MDKTFTRKFLVDGETVEVKLKKKFAKDANARKKPQEAPKPEQQK